VPLPRRLALSLDYKGVLNTVNDRYYNYLEPILGWTFGNKSHWQLTTSVEIPLDDEGYNFTAKGGVTRLF
jgi:hypothetical protein